MKNVGNMIRQIFAPTFFIFFMTDPLAGSAESPPTAPSPPALYRMGAASEAVLRCRGLQIVDKGSQAEAYRDAKAKSISSRAMVMGIEDFDKEFSAAQVKGLEQRVCDKYLRRYPALLMRR